MVASPAAVSRLPDGGRFVALDSLRGICALGVAAFHVGAAGPLFGSRLVGNAWLLVDFFFVLSGFVIAASYGDRLAGGFPVGRFMLLRLGRVYPLHLAVLAAYLALEVAVWAFLPDGVSQRMPFESPRSLPELLISIFLLQGFLTGGSLIWNGLSWSIAVEVWLYLAIALGWAALGRKAWWAGLAAALAAAVALGLEWSDQVVPFSWYLLRGVLGFGMGVTCWQVWRGGRLRASCRLATLAEVAACAGCLAVIAWRPFGPWCYVAADLAFAFAIIVFAGERGRVSQWLGAGPWVLLGTLSYSIYMIHPLVFGRLFDLMAVFGLSEVVMGEVPIRRIVAPPLLADLIAVAMLGVVVGVAWFTWRLIEHPARQWSRKRAAKFGAGREESAAPTI